MISSRYPFGFFKHADRFNRLVAVRFRVPDDGAVPGQVFEFRRVDLAAALSDANRGRDGELHRSCRSGQRQHPGGGVVFFNRSADAQCRRRRGP